MPLSISNFLSWKFHDISNYDWDLKCALKRSQVCYHIAKQTPTHTHTYKHKEKKCFINQRKCHKKCTGFKKKKKSWSVMTCEKKPAVRRPTMDGSKNQPAEH